MRTVGIIVLVVLIVILGLPLAMGMGGMVSTGQCPECQTTGGYAALGLCLAILGTILLLTLGALGEAVVMRLRRFTLATSGGIERPPRSFSL